MTDTKIVKIELETSFTGDDVFQKLPKEVEEVTKVIVELDKGIKTSEGVFKVYNKELLQTSNLLSTIAGLQKGKLVKPVAQTSTESKEVKAKKDASEELTRLLIAEQKTEEKLRNQHFTRIGQAILRANKEEEKLLKAKTKKLEQIATLARKKEEKVRAATRPVNSSLDKELVVEFKKEESLRNQHYTRLGQAYLKANKAQETALKASNKRKEAEAKRHLTASLKGTKDLTSKKIAEVKRAVSLELSEAKTSSVRIEAIKKASNVRQLELERELQKALAIAGKRLSGGALKSAQTTAFTSFSAQVSKTAATSAASVAKVTKRQAHLNALKKQGLVTTQATTTSQNSQTKATKNTGDAAARLLNTNKSILRHVFEVVAGYRLINAIINKTQQALVNIPVFGVEEQANLAALTGSFGSSTAVDEFELASTLADKYGASLRGLEVSMRKFAPSALLAGASLEQVNTIFDDFTAVGTVLHKTEDEMQSVFLALEQIFAKGTVQSEEIKKQLGNQLPAAVEIGAQAMEMSVSDFFSAMKRNEIHAKKFVPKFAKLYRTLFAGEGDAVLKTLADKVFANYNRLLNRYTDLNRAIFGETEGVLNKGLKSLIDVVTFTTKHLNALAATLKVVAAIITTRVVVATASHIKHMIVEGITAQRTAQAVVVANLRMAKSYRVLTVAETQALAVASAHRSVLSLSLAGLLSKGKNLVTLLTGLSAPVLGIIVAIGALGTGIFKLLGFTLSYTKANKLLVDGNAKTTKSLKELGTEYTKQATEILKALRELNAEEKTPEVVEQIKKKVLALGDLEKVYTSTATQLGLTSTESKKLVKDLTQLSAEFAKATIEGGKLSQVELREATRSFEEGKKVIIETASALNTLANEYVTAQKEADVLAGEINSTEHYAKLKEAASFALKELEKQRQATNDFYVGFGEQQITLSRFLIASWETTSEDIKKVFYSLWEELEGTAKTAVDTIVNHFARIPEVFLGIADRSIAVGKSLSEGDSIATALTKGNQAFLDSSGSVLRTLEVTGSLAGDILTNAGESFSIYAKGFITDSRAMEAAIQGRTKAEKEALEETIKSFQAGVKVSEIPNSPTGGAGKGRAKRTEEAVDSTKKALAELKNTYDQDLINIEYYFSEKTRLEDEFFTARIAKREQEIVKLQKVSSEESRVKAIEINREIDQLREQLIAKKTKTKGEEEADQIKFIDLVNKERIAYLELSGQFTKAAIERTKLRDTNKLKAEAELHSSLNKKEAEELKTIQDSFTMRILQQGEFTDSLRETTIAQEALSNSLKVGNAQVETYNSSFLEGLFQRTEANERYASVQRQILEEAEAGYKKEADLSGKQRRQLDASFASLISFELKANEVSNSVKGNLTQNLSTAFSDFITGTKSAEEAMKDFSLAVLDSMAQIAANQLATQLIGGIFSLGNSGGGSSSFAGTIDGAFSGLSVGTTSAGNTASILNALTPKQFANGGIPDIGNSPATFKLGSLRENGKTEAILPVYRTENGDLGVKTSGDSSSGGINIGSINVTVQGTEQEPSEQSAEIAKAIRIQLKALIRDQMKQATKSGGLYNNNTTQAL